MQKHKVKEMRTQIREQEVEVGVFMCICAESENQQSTGDSRQRGSGVYDKKGEGKEVEDKIYGGSCQQKKR